MNHSLAALSAALDGRYRVDRELGQGGMATVYLAEDLKHRRKVAIKVLRPELAAVIGADRFVREIQTIATLQHPHILGLIDSGEIEGTAYYVMPFVEGESLRDRLAREKQLPVADAVRLAGEVAGALDYAHRHGVIHRDIKPENILLHDGSALVADFGIALAMSTAGTRMTETGMSLGTPHYMSPEQAMGERELDARSDVYALGCVTYEMLLGEPPFTGPTAQAIVARVVTDTPRPIVLQRKSVPLHVEAAVLTALEKLPADRFASAREFADAISGKTSMPVSATTMPLSSNARSTLWKVGAVALLAGAMLGGGTYAMIQRSTGRANAPIDWVGERLGGPPVAAGPRVSPDGQTIAFQAMVDGQTQVAVLKPASGDWAVLTSDRTRGIAQEFEWSRDGSKIYYARSFQVPRGIWSISPIGGEERLVLEDAGNPLALPDGTLLVTRVAGRRLRLFHYWPETARIEPVDATTTFSWNGSRFRASPDGKRVVYWGRPASDTSDRSGIFILDLSSGRSQLLARTIAGGEEPDGLAFSPDGRWVVLARLAGNLLQYFAIASDGSGRERNLYSATGGTQWGADVGPDGSLYISDMARSVEIHRFKPPNGKLERTVIEAGGSTKAILPLPDGRILVPSAAAGKPRLMAVGGAKGATPFVVTEEGSDAPTAMLGSELVLIHLVGADGSGSIGVVSTRTGRIVKRIPIAGVVNLAGSPDGKTIFFTKDGGVWQVDLNGGTPRRLTAGNAVAVDPNGRYLVVNVVDTAGVRLVRLALDGGKEEEIVVRGDMQPAPGFLSPNAIGPDGRIVLQVVGHASWFWPAGIFDPTTGKLEITPSGLTYDMLAGWANDGSTISAAVGLESRMWRLKPVGGAKWWR